MYDNRLRLYGSIDDLTNQIVQQESPKYAWNPDQPQQHSVSSALQQGKQSNLPRIGSGAAQPQRIPNNSTIGNLGTDGNWASALTAMVDNYLAINNQKQAEDKKMLQEMMSSSGGAGGMGSLGGAGGLGALAALSDKRAKENIRPVGKLDNGLTVYAFNYKGQKQTIIGLIAQEVQEVIPEAVIEGEDGLLRVNYDLATKGK